VSGGATKEAKLVVKTALSFLGVSFPSLPSFEERSGVVGFFCSEVEPLPWVEPELLFFCLECKEPLPDLLSDWKSQTSVWSCFWRFRKHEFHGILHCIIPSIEHR